jgi:DNA-binding NtrC family response regulator
LRVLQEGRFRRVGDERAIQVDVRVVGGDEPGPLDRGQGRALPPRPLLSIERVLHPAPALRDRKGDIPLLVAHVLDRMADEIGGPAPKLSSALLRRLEEYAFPGNIRELRNVLTALILRTQGAAPTLTDLDNLLADADGRDPAARAAAEPVEYDDDDGAPVELPAPPPRTRARSSATSRPRGRGCSTSCASATSTSARPSAAWRACAARPRAAPPHRWPTARA